LVVELTSSGPTAESSLPGGESGNPFSPHYVDLLENGLFNETHDLLIEPDDDPGSVTEEFVPAL
jgi:acyl-homoserine lactone acylase PvdQ